MIDICSKGDLEGAKLMVEKGISFDVEDYDQRTPIHLAASERHSDLVEYLAKTVKNINPIDRWGFTPIDDANRRKFFGVYQILT